MHAGCALTSRSSGSPSRCAGRRPLTSGVSHRKMRTLILIVVLALLSSCARLSAPIHSNRSKAVLAHSSKDARFQFTGTWEGTLHGYDAPHYVDSAGFPMRFRFVISRWDVHVYNMVKGSWHEMKRGDFRMRNVGPHALIYSTTSGRDQDGVWVESSTFTLAHTSPQEIVVYWQRTVNNLDVPSTNQWYQFAWGYAGTVQRVPSGG